MWRVAFTLLVLAGFGSEAVAVAAERAAPPRSLPSGSPALRMQIASILIAKGFRCAKVFEVKPLKVIADTYHVSCTEYRDRPGRVHYIVDAALHTAFRAD